MCTGPTEDDEPYVHSFYDDVSQNPQIVRAMLGVTHGIQKAVSGLARVTEGWKVHQPLWKLDKGTVLDKFKVTSYLNSWQTFRISALCAAFL